MQQYRIDIPRLDPIARRALKMKGVMAVYIEG